MNVDRFGDYEFAIDASEQLLIRALKALKRELLLDGRIDPAKMEQRQFESHGLAWLATYVEALRQMFGWAKSLDQAGRFSELEQALLAVTIGEYLSQIRGGIPLSQSEIFRPCELADDLPATSALADPVIDSLIRKGGSQEILAAITQCLEQFEFPRSGLDEDHELIRDQFKRFVERNVAPFAHTWHLNNELIPLQVIDDLASLGAFGITIPKQYGGLGLDKLSMCLVSEELSRGYIGVGSLGTRCEIASELILLGGTDSQRQRWLPGIADGSVIPTAVFTEPNTGSDLGSLKTRARRNAQHDGYRITGAKTWITHGARSDLMTLLARTDPEESGYRGLSMFLIEKPRGSDPEPFPATGMSGSEIEVLGYRGMKEFEIGFDGYETPADSLLGGEEGKGFKQLMQTFESARIQTASRAVGVAQAALECGLEYALHRKQFRKRIFSFPRIFRKLVMMTAETMVARQLSYSAARAKDSGRRCDAEAGMAKLLASRVAWANADNAVQIHGGNGYAIEYEISRILCDARILSIFEGTAEIQAQIIAQALLRSTEPSGT